MRKTIIKWTWPKRALKRIKSREAVAAGEFNQVIRAFYDEGIWDWTGHIAPDRKVHGSCGCQVCQHARFMR